MCVWSLGGGLQSAVSVNVYLHTAPVSSMLKSPLVYELTVLSFLSTLSSVTDGIMDRLKASDCVDCRLTNVNGLEANGHKLGIF